MALLRGPLLAVIMMAATLATSSSASEPLPIQLTQGEYAIKAAYIFNFLKFVTWPAEALPPPDRPLVIAVLADEPFNSFLVRTVENEVWRGRSIRVEQWQQPREVSRIQMLVVDRQREEGTEQLLAAAARRGVLTIGETEDFLQRGGMIALITRSNRVQLVINQKALRAARIEVSSKLLRVAEIR